jgi:hypothetical protein
MSYWCGALKPRLDKSLAVCYTVPSARLRSEGDVARTGNMISIKREKIIQLMLHHPCAYTRNEIEYKKRRAMSIVAQAIKDGRLERPDACSNCGDRWCRIHGHHEDYDKPLEVMWLCSRCHPRSPNTRTKFIW